MFVKDIMNANPVVCLEDTPLIQAYELMLENNCDCITVIDSHCHKIPLGIITEHDICLMIIKHGRTPKSLTAENVMNNRTPKAIYTKNWMDCVDLIEESDSKRLLIVNEKGGLCGILQKSDIETSKTNQHFEDLFSRAMAKEYQPSSFPAQWDPKLGIHVT